MQLATEIYNLYVQYNAVAIYVDGGGVGGGVVDRLNQLGAPVYEVTFGGKSDNVNTEDPMAKYANKRAEIWGAMRSWLKTGCIPEEIPQVEESLPTEMSNPTYTYAREDYIQLESKKDMRRRNVASPDASDALACTFAYPALEIAPDDPLSSDDANNHYEDENPYEDA